MGNIPTAPLQYALRHQDEPESPASSTSTSTTKKQRNKRFSVLLRGRSHKPSSFLLPMMKKSSSDTNNNNQKPTTPVALPSRPRPYLFGTLSLNRLADVDHALRGCEHRSFFFSTTSTASLTTTSTTSELLPRKILVSGKFVSGMTNLPTKHHQRSIRRLLKRGCLELELVGQSPTAPRRVYDQDVAFLLERLQHDMIQQLVIRNLNILTAVGGGGGRAASSSTTVQSSPRRLLLLTTAHIRNPVATNLRKLTNLQVLHLLCSHLQDDLLHDLLLAMDDLPLLRDFALVFSVSGSGHDSSSSSSSILPAAFLQEAMEVAVTKLLKRNVVQKLTLSFYPTSPQLWWALKQCTSLQSLSLHGVETNSLVQLQDLLLLQQPQPLPSSPNTTSLNQHAPCLRQLQLWVTPEQYASSNCQSYYFGALAQGLQHNTTLETLHIRILDHDWHTTNDNNDNNNNNNSSVVPNAKQPNKAEQCADWLVHKCLESILKHDNFTLSCVEVDLWTVREGAPRHVATPVLDFYTKLNAANNLTTTSSLSSSSRGRAHLLRGNATRDEWIATLASASDNLSSLYYWLRVQPTLLLLHQQQQQQQH